MSRASKYSGTLLKSSGATMVLLFGSVRTSPSLASLTSASRIGDP
ncbi:hypothetical protein [Mesorhizobium sp. M0142]